MALEHLQQLFGIRLPGPTPPLASNLKQRFDALKVVERQLLLNCAGIGKFLPRAIAYLEVWGNGRFSDDVVNFMLGRGHELPKGLDKPFPEISAEVQDILEGLLAPKRSRLPGVGAAPGKTIDILRALQSTLDPFRLLHPLDIVTFEGRFEALTPEHTQTIVNCEGLYQFLPRAVAYLEQWRKSGFSGKVTDFLTGQREDLPSGLQLPDPAIPIEVQAILEPLLTPDRLRLPATDQAMEKAINIFRTLDALMTRHRLSQMAAETFEGCFGALTIENIQTIAGCEGLYQFLPRAVEYLERWHKSDFSGDVTDFLTGQREDLPSGLKRPDSAIPVDVQAILKPLLGPYRLRLPATPEAAQQAINIFRTLHSLMTAHRLPPPVGGVVTVAREGFKERFDALTLEDTRAVAACGGLDEFLPRAVAYLKRWGKAGHSGEVIDFLTGERNDLPAGLDRPPAEIGAGVRAILKGLLGPDRPKLPATSQALKKATDALHALQSELARLKQPALQRVGEGPEASDAAAVDPDTKALIQRFEALTIEQKELLACCTPLQSFIVDAAEFIHKPQYHHHSEAVAHFLMGLSTKLPKELPAPHEPIPGNVKEVLKGVLCTHEYSFLFWKNEPPLKTFRKLNAVNILTFCVQFRGRFSTMPRGNDTRITSDFSEKDALASTLSHDPLAGFEPAVDFRKMLTEKNTPAKVVPAQTGVVPAQPDVVPPQPDIDPSQPDVHPPQPDVDPAQAA